LRIGDRPVAPHGAKAAFDGDPFINRPVAFSRLYPHALGAGAASHPGATGPVAGPGGALPGCSAGSDHDGIHQPATDSGCYELAPSALRSPRGRADRCGTAAGIRSGVYRARKFPASAGYDGAEHRRLCRHRGSIYGRSGGGGGCGTKIAGPGVCRGRVAHQFTTDRSGAAAGWSARLCNSACEPTNSLCASI
jgi:hypothetical protein